MRKYLHMIKPLDVIIVVALMLLSFLPYVLFARHEAASNAQRGGQPRVLTAVVSHDGKEVYRIRLTGHTGTSKFRYSDGHDYNEIVTTGSRIAITDANCSDQVCVRKGQISQPGETIVCLPHKLLIEIKSSTGEQTGGMVTQ
ncbi:NusG domain II-containing protein [Lacticaseibacillus parakribbianus]|uniref:NusG domain II-containing protein n=1 Tax=Lacticaseibacillus parakribbianus TaxID=2970927 RepID=UPI0021CAF5E8|nr:NusG domain II-containing protein [Lacticaseibacillus parakribbianus]